MGWGFLEKTFHHCGLLGKWWVSWHQGSVKDQLIQFWFSSFLWFRIWKWTGRLLCGVTWPFDCLESPVLKLRPEFEKGNSVYEEAVEWKDVLTRLFAWKFVKIPMAEPKHGESSGTFSPRCVKTKNYVPPSHTFQWNLEWDIRTCCNGTLAELERQRQSLSWYLLTWQLHFVWVARILTKNWPSNLNWGPITFDHLRLYW